MTVRNPLAALAIAVSAAAALGFASASWGQAESKSPADHARHMQAGQGAAPTMPGQDAFGAVQEIIRILDADPNTDWSKVDMAGLREHLIDMNEVTLKAAAAERKIDNGVQIDVTGEGRTREAIQRMLPAHARELNGMPGWRATTAPIPGGIRLTVTADGAKAVARVRGLGFIGLMASDGHHQPHHLAMARGQHIH